MTDMHYKIDPELLEDGEHVLWAVGDLKPKKKWVYPEWLDKVTTILYFVFLAFIFIFLWQSVKNGRDLSELFSQTAWQMLVMLIFMAINNWAKSKGMNWQQQSAYYVGMITNYKLVLFNADKGAEHTLYPGDISGVYSDYSNGAPALRLALPDGAADITMVTSGDLVAAQKLIESNFLLQSSGNEAAQ